ncbi:uncharacterized protein N7511_006317 [Penicillium nucicola]|uniref:uncharacterized protein n=1 Tax=Penicillium nucicola TaxID=1850975 RepID=UPI002544DEE3|nr:uncharacterized protein N7511_006317 [Penicillium nucicola]KAJ5757623.1 hypothetical protein N7511_006317 [Penicillium nucicola]
MRPTSLPPIYKGKLMFFDEVLWDKGDELLASWKSKLFNQATINEVINLIQQHREGIAHQLFPPQKGAFNMVIRLRFVDGASTVIRLPIPGYSVFPEEKVQREVSVMRFLERHTDIRVPHILHYGMTDQSPGQLGPFIIMEYIENNADLVDALNTPGLLLEDRPILDPDISPPRLRSVYSDMAGLMLQVAKFSFNAIGCISNNETNDLDNEWVVKHRPLSINMNELVQVGGVARADLPQRTFTSGSEYFLALAELHMVHLSSQEHDAVDSAEDCRMKYIARCLFRKLAREKRLCRFEGGPFKLYCDDLRPANILANSNFDYKICGAIDWEFSYAAPADFVYAPPCWLLLERPEYWDKGLNDWARLYEQQLEVWLEAMVIREDADIARGVIGEANRLSGFMRESWGSGDFWVSYAARRSWAFDVVYWARIDRRFFGEGTLEDRVALLTMEERRDMEEFVRKKMNKMVDD